MDDVLNEPPEWLLKSMEEGRADIAAGRFGPSDDVLSEIYAAIAELEEEYGAEVGMPQVQQHEH